MRAENLINFLEEKNAKGLYRPKSFDLQDEIAMGKSANFLEHAFHRSIVQRIRNVGPKNH